MEKSKEEVSVCRISESTVTLNENVAGETLEESVDCSSQGQIEGFGGEDTGGCSGKDVMVEVLGSDVYIDGVCTRGNEAELNDDVACGGSVEVDKDVKPSGGVFGVGNQAEAGLEASQVKQSSEARSENATAHLDAAVVDRDEVLMGTSKDHNPERGEAPILSNEIDVAHTHIAPVLDNGAEKEVGIGVSESLIVVNFTPEGTEVPTIKDAHEAGVRDEKLTNTFDNALGGLTTVSSSDVENVHNDSVEEDYQPQRNLADHGATKGGNDVTFKPLDEQKKIASGEGDKILEKEACVQYQDDSLRTVATDEELHSAGVQPMDIDKFGENSNFPPKEVVAKAEVSVEMNLLSSDQKCFTLQKCIEKKMIHDTLQVSSDTGQGLQVDKQFHAEDFTSLGREQNSVNHETTIASPNREGTVNSNNEVKRCALYEQQQNKRCLETDVIGDLALIDTGSRKQVKLIENVGSSEGKEEEVEDQSASINRGSSSANVQGISVSSGVAENNFEANIISRSVEDNQTADVGISEQVDSLGGKEMEIEEFNNASHDKLMDEKAIKHTVVKPGSSGRCYQANYLLPPETEGEFSVSDMVWGKVRSHPWWPGQIFDPSDSSEKAMKHYKKDCFLVAYFGDRTFAWNEASQLKPFRAHFPNIEKQSNSESFQNAVECALDEISRRVEFGLACSCIPKDTYDEIKLQSVENTGIREEISLRYGMDESLNANSFSPDKLIEYMKCLSQCPTGGFDRLELVIAKAQLLAFYRLKGYSFLPELQHCGGLDNDLDSSIHDAENNLNEDIQHATPVSKNADQASVSHRVSKGQNSSYHKRKHNLKDGMYPKKKEKSLSEIFSGPPDSPDGDYCSDEKANDNLVSPTLSKKRRTFDPYADDSGMQNGRKTISLAKVSSSTKPSFKIGECIRRVASQLTGTSTAKSSGDRSPKPDESTDVFSGDVSDVPIQNVEEAQRSSLTVPTEYSSLNDLLSLLQGVAQDPLDNCNFLSVIVSFFSDFRNSIVVGNYSGREVSQTNKVGAKRKKLPVAGSPETFEFEDMSDTYWTDRVIQNGSEEQPPKRSRKRDNQPVPTDPEKPVQVSRRTYSRKRYSDSINAEASEKPSGYIDERSPAELVMNFAELDSVPSETNLNKMFRRFGPLKESETEVDTMSSRARVVFKKCADAEVAFNSAKKFNIFGPILVNYQLNYTPSALFKASTVATTHDQEMHLDLSNFEVNMV